MEKKSTKQILYKRPVKLKSEALPGKAKTAIGVPRKEIKRFQPVNQPVDQYGSMDESKAIPLKTRKNNADIKNRYPLEDPSQKIVTWIKTHPLFKWSGMCKQIGLHPSNFNTFVLQAKNPVLKPESIKLIEEVLKKYGYGQ